ncbi:glycerate kinase [Parafrigoribacterium soli]|uniref:glycerate kinase n=1 Tax=Parafrigoribacterium soli TaxID=3144663 RepID=UPI0032EC44C2
MQLSVVIAPDSFKGTLPARRVAEAIAAGWRSVRQGDALVLLPQADGGEGTLDAVESAVPGSVRRDAGLVSGPDGRRVPGEWLELPGGVAVIELAQMCGLPLMGALDPMMATTYGLGEVIRAALASGARKLVIGLGGSASTDGGAGALAALGLVAQGGELRASELARLASLQRGGLVTPPVDGVVLLSDVTAPLLGTSGAAHVFGPQKGAAPDQVELLDTGLARFAELLGGDPTLSGSGAAGGTAYGFAAAWGASIEPGAPYLSRLSRLPDAVGGASLIITGEGSFDATSTAGKVVGHVIALAGRVDVPVRVIAGRLEVPPVGADGSAIPASSLTELAGSAGAAMGDPTRWLRAAGAESARSFASDG